MIKFRRTLLAVAVCGLCAGPATTRGDEEPQKVTFDEHIKPIFREHCTACHSVSDKSSDLALDSYGDTLAGGSGGDVVVEGDAGGSRLWALITHAEQPFMPPDQDPIPETQRVLVKTWIEQGMPENAGSKIKKSNKSAMAMLATTSLGKPEGPPAMPENLLTEPVVETARSAAISAMAASPWAPLVALGGQEQVTFYHSETGELLGIVPFPEGEPQSLTFTRDGKQLLIGGGRHSHSGCAVLVDVSTGERITKVGDELDIVMAADISPDKSRIALAGPQKLIRIYDSMSGDMLLEIKKHTDWVFALRFSPDGVLLASGDRSNGLVVWEADTGRQYADLVGHKGEVRGLDFRADSNVLASGSLDGTIKLWDMFENREVKSWGAHGGGVTAIMFAQNGLLASAGRDARIKLWNANGELQKEFAGLTESALEVALTGDASAIAGGDWNGQATIWPADDPSQARPIAANPPSIDIRLAAATARLGEVKSQHAAVAQEAAAAAANAAQSQTELEAKRSSAAQLQQQVAGATSEASLATTEITSVDAQINELEKQLLALKQQRDTLVTRLAAAQQAVTTGEQQSAEVNQSIVTMESRQQELTNSATTTEVKRQELADKLAVAQAAVDKETAAKVALEARARELAQLATAAETMTQALSDEAGKLAGELEKHQTALAGRTQEMQQLQEQLAKLQEQLAAVQAAASSTTEQLGSAQTEQTELQSKLEESQQAAFAAKEEWELFQRSYNKPD